MGLAGPLYIVKHVHIAQEEKGFQLGGSATSARFGGRLKSLVGVSAAAIRNDTFFALFSVGWSCEPRQTTCYMVASFLRAPFLCLF